MRLADHDAGHRSAPPTLGTTTRMVAVLLILYAFSFLDRQILSLLLDSIRRDLDISATEVSLLQGFAFAAFYAVLGLPIGAAVDRWSRRWIIFAGVVTWGLATAACGLAQDFWGMFAARLLVGAGEAALLPAAYSLLGDGAASNRMARYMSIFAIGAPVGAGIALLAGGSLVQFLSDHPGALTLFGITTPWRLTFLLVGLPGVVLAFLVFAFPDARRLSRNGTAARWRDVFDRITRHARFYGGLVLGFSMLSLAGYGLLGWMPTYLHRTFGMPFGTIGLTMAAAMVPSTILGSLLCGWSVDRWYGRGRQDAHVRFFAITVLLQLPLIVGAFLTRDLTTCLALFCLSQIPASFMGVSAAALQMVTPPLLRGRISALYLFAFNLIGFGGGPYVVALLTEIAGGDQALGLGIILTCLIAMPLAALILLATGPAMRRALNEKKRDTFRVSK